MYPAEHFRDVLGLMTVAELCAAIDVTKETLARWRVQSQGPRYTKLGRSIFYRRVDVRNWVNQCTYAPGPLPLGNDDTIKPSQLDLEDYIEGLEEKVSQADNTVTSEVTETECSNA